MKDAPGAPPGIAEPSAAAQPLAAAQNDHQDELGRLQAVWKSLWSTHEPTRAECARLIGLCGFTNAQMLLTYWLADWEPRTRKFANKVMSPNIGALLNISHLREGLLADALGAAERATKEAEYEREQERYRLEAEAHRLANPPPPPPPPNLPEVPNVHESGFAAADWEGVDRHWQLRGGSDGYLTGRRMDGSIIGRSQDLCRYGRSTLGHLVKRHGVATVTLMIDHLLKNWESIRRTNFAGYTTEANPTLFALWKAQDILLAAIPVKLAG